MRVAGFFSRSHSHPFEISQQDPKKAVRSLSNHFSSRPSTDRTSSSSSSVASDDLVTRMPDVPGHNKRHSLTMNSPRSSSKSLPQVHGHGKLRVEIESPPLVFFNTAQNSTGALLSGQLKFDITDEKMVIEKFEMKLVVDVKMKKPFHAHCTDCAHQSTELNSWNFLQGPATFNKGTFVTFHQIWVC